MRRHLTTLPQPTKNWLFSPNIVRAVASCLFLALSLLEQTRSRLCEHLVTLPVSYSRFGERSVCRCTWLIAAVERPFRQHDALPSAISRLGGEIWLDWQAAERAMPSGGARLQAWWLFFVRQMHMSTIIPMQAYTCIICLKLSSGWRVLVNYWLWGPRGTVSIRSERLFQGAVWICCTSSC